MDREIAEALTHIDAKGERERSKHPHIQVGSRVELPVRSEYRFEDPDTGFEGDTHGDVVKIRGNAAWVRMDSDRMDWFNLADLRLAPSGGQRHATKKSATPRTRSRSAAATQKRYRLVIAGPTGRYTESEFTATKDEALAQARRELEQGAVWVRVDTDVDHLQRTYTPVTEMRK